MKNEDLLAVLEKSRDHLSNINNWCDRGAGDGARQCAMVTPQNYTKNECDFITVKKRLADACEALFGTREVAMVNDGCGHYSPSFDLPKVERHARVIKIYDKAITTVKELVS